MSEYTPTTDEMRFAWADRVNKHDQEGAEEFDRWLAEVQREAAEKAWDECYYDTHEWYSTKDETLYTAPENPYRKDEE